MLFRVGVSTIVVVTRIVMIIDSGLFLCTLIFFQ